MTLLNFVITGAPATQVEIYIIAMALDSDGDQQLDYREFKKLSRRLKLGSERIRKTAEKEDNEETPTQQIQLRPCPNCNVGLWEPIVEDVLGLVVDDKKLLLESRLLVLRRGLLREQVVRALEPACHFGGKTRQLSLFHQSATGFSENIVQAEKKL